MTFFQLFSIHTGAGAGQSFTGSATLGSVWVVLLTIVVAQVMISTESTQVAYCKQHSC